MVDRIFEYVDHGSLSAEVIKSSFFVIDMLQCRLVPLLKSKAALSFSNSWLVGDIKYIHVQRKKETEHCEK